MSFITSIGTAVPSNRFDQSTIADFMVRAMQLNQTDTRKLRTIFRSSGIQYRYSVLDDYGKDHGFSFYSNSDDFEPFPSTEKRLEVYRKHALALSARAIEDCLKQRSDVGKREITHLIIVSCTGMYAPGLDIDLVKTLHFKEDVQRICINFMGCYAAFNAVKVADAFCKNDEHAKALIVCVEMCSLHFQKEPSEDNLLANALFADGAAALLMESKPSKTGGNFSPEVFHSTLSYNGVEHMAWNIGNLGFEMRLSTYVPDIIRGGIKDLTGPLLQKVNNALHDVAYFAIHPGGRKILEAIEQELGLSKEQNESSYFVLNNYGNMSSPTVLFVLKRILGKLAADDRGKNVLSVAFGPGLTMESMLLKIHLS